MTISRLLFFILAACRPGASQSPAGSRPVSQPFGVAPSWIAALREAGVVSEDRQTVHVSHTCDLLVDGRLVHVVDLRQVLADMPAPRGFNTIVLLDEALTRLQTLPYVDERPMRCDGNRLLLYDSLSYPATGSESGNVVVVTDAGRSIEMLNVPLAEIPWEAGFDHGAGAP